jgi:ferredoxin
MIRKIITIDKDACNGCGLCIDACHEGAIGLVDGKATLLRDDYCDGLGNCLPACPTNAITFVEREALEYNEEEVQKNIARKKEVVAFKGCPGTASHSIKHEEAMAPVAKPQESQLSQWPVQIKLVPVNAPYFDGSNLLVAADCTAFSYGDFHNKFIKNHITLIGCPKLDEGDYAEKLTEIIKHNNIKSIKVVRMTVPCCGGIVNAVTTALRNSGKMIPWQVVTISPDGSIVEM